MGADNVVEYLADCKQETRDDQVYWYDVRTIPRIATQPGNKKKKNLPIGRGSPSIRSTKMDSKTKKTTRQMSGQSWYNT